MKTGRGYGGAETAHAPRPPDRQGPRGPAPGGARTDFRPGGVRTGFRPAAARAGFRLCRLAAVLALAVLLPSGAGAGLVGEVEQRAAVAGRSDAALIEANPLLRRLRGAHPELLREALERLRTPAGASARSLERPAPPPESGVLEENPDLDTLYRESPEAALDLIRLIREATQKK